MIVCTIKLENEIYSLTYIIEYTSIQYKKGTYFIGIKWKTNKIEFLIIILKLFKILYNEAMIELISTYNGDLVSLYFGWWH